MRTPLTIVFFGILLAIAVGIPHAEAQDDHGEDMTAEEDYEYDPQPPRPESMLTWTFKALGWRYTLALPLAGLLAFVIALAVVLRGGPNAASALLFVVPIPLLVGVFGLFDSLIMSLQVVSMTAFTPRTSEIAHVISTALVPPLIGMLLMAPAYLVATAGLVARAFARDRQVKQVKNA